jgi:hypothetical protein
MRRTQPIIPRTIAASLFWSSFIFLLGLVNGAMAQEAQNPSPMVEHTRSHERLQQTRPAGQRHEIGGGTFFVPDALATSQRLPLLIFFHGGTWLPEVAAERSGLAVLTFPAGAKDGGYAALAKGPKQLREWIDAASAAGGVSFSSVTLGGWSAGCQAIRELLRDADTLELVDAVIAIDGIHTSYPSGKPGPKESEIDTAKLTPWLEFARSSVAERKRLLITHTEIFPGTFASTTETADWLLRELGVKRRAVLAWGPRGAQQLSEARSGNFLLRGYAGNSAPDHVDLLHALPEYLESLKKMPPEPPQQPLP